MIWYKDKKRAMLQDVLNQAKFDSGKDQLSASDILDVLFPDHGEGRSSGEFYVYWWENPWSKPKAAIQRVNMIWFLPLFILLIAPTQWLLNGKVGFDQRTKMGEVVLKLIGEDK
jgi:hypothetical protein